MTAHPSSARVVIVGGGFAGLSTASALVRAGITEVVVVEKERTCGYHASGRNAALGRQITEHDAVTELTVRGAALLRTPPPTIADGPLVDGSGSILLVDTEAQKAALVDRADAFGVDCIALDSNQVTARWSRLAGVSSAGGVAFPGDGVIDIHGLLQGLYGSARRGGARVQTGVEVTSIGFSAEGATAATVQTSAGPIDAEVVVIAAGAWATEVGRRAGVDRVFVPRKRHLFQTERLLVPEKGAPFVWHVGEREFYVRPEGAGLLVSGCDERDDEPSDVDPDDGAVAALAARLSPLAPAVAELGIARTWACLRTFAPNRQFVIDWDANQRSLYWVAGLGGHGATASLAVGERAANAIVARLGTMIA